jgi:hypothetical protein
MCSNSSFVCVKPAVKGDAKFSIMTTAGTCCFCKFMHPWYLTSCDRQTIMPPASWKSPGLRLSCAAQALMGATCFCDFLELLTRCQPLLDAKAAPTLSALAAFAAEFKPVEAPPTPAAPKGAP